MNFFFRWETSNAGYRSLEMLQFLSKHTVTKTMFTLYHIALGSVTNCILDRAFVHTTTNIWAHFLYFIAAETLCCSKWYGQYSPIQFKEFNPIILLRTQHCINKEKLYFLARKTNSMDTEEEHILATDINLINVVNEFINLQMDFIFSIWSYYNKSF